MIDTRTLLADRLVDPNAPTPPTKAEPPRLTHELLADGDDLRLVTVSMTAGVYDLHVRAADGHAAHARILDATLADPTALAAAVARLKSALQTRRDRGLRPNPQDHCIKPAVLTASTTRV